MREFDMEGPPLLVQMADAVEEEWTEGDWAEVLLALRVLKDFGQEMTWEAIGLARRDGQTWNTIADHLGMTRQATWEKYRTAEPDLPPRAIPPEGRQGYFQEFLMERLLGRWGGRAVSLEDLYSAASDEADEQYIDRQQCRHNQRGFEWQHDLRWSLLKLKCKGLVGQPQRSWYEANLPDVQR